MVNTDLRKVVVVDGCRTPFLRSGTDFFDLSTYDLGCSAVSGLLHRARVDPTVVEMLVMGRVVPDPHTTNLAREVVFGTDLRNDCAAFTVTAACVSSLQATAEVVRAIQTGACEVGIAAGADTASDVPLQFRRPVRRRLIAAQKARGASGYLKLLRGLRPRDLMPEQVAIAERSTGETMGQSCERLAKRFGISREEQDEFALASHHRAAQATADGTLGRQIAPVFVPPRYGSVRVDNGVRGDTSLDKLGKLKPAFDRRTGTVTAGNASFLSDGAAAVLLMSQEKAEQLGIEPRVTIRSMATTAMEPVEELLLGPAIAAPKALERAGIELDDAEVVELHEAFAAQVLAVLRAMEDPKFCRERLGRETPVGRVDRERLNAWGGSLSVGHPFGATGARLVTNCAQRMLDGGARFGLLAACAAGALGIGMVLEQS
ncbi:MAG: acetyl-CoA C-acyltransferase [Planctomycetota bacterium]